MSFFSFWINENIIQCHDTKVLAWLLVSLKSLGVEYSTVKGNNNKTRFRVFKIELDRSLSEKEAEDLRLQLGDPPESDEEDKDANSLFFHCQ